MVFSSAPQPTIASSMFIAEVELLPPTESPIKPPDVVLQSMETNSMHACCGISLTAKENIFAPGVIVKLPSNGLVRIVGLAVEK